MLFLSTTVDGLQMGLCYAILALGVYISYSVLNFADLSVDGTFPLGGIVCTLLMLRLGISPIIAVVITFLSGLLAGTVTGILHVKFKISDLLSGIIVMTALLSVTLALTSLLTDLGNTTTIFSFRSKNLDGVFGGGLFSELSGDARDWAIIGVLVLFVIFFKLVIDLFLKTKLGYMLKATGNNPILVTTLGKDTGKYKILGLALANGFVSVSGAMYANLFMQYDNTCGSGKVVMALASVIIGIAVFTRIKIFKDTTAVILGALVYSLCLNYLVLVDKNGIYLKLLNAVMFALILIFNEKVKNLTKRKKVAGEVSENA
ncbi:MAG: ABC transporter permease [Clostridiales bacterium]|nr:ABC transporter permease [Candidatus Equinaster intestinalis]